MKKGEKKNERKRQKGKKKGERGDKKRGGEKEETPHTCPAAAWWVQGGLSEAIK